MDASLDLRRALAEIDKALASAARAREEAERARALLPTELAKVTAEAEQLRRDTRLEPIRLFLAGLGASAALFAAGGAFAWFFP